MDSSALYYDVPMLAGLIAFITAWGLPLDNWWVRSVDFPCIQIVVLRVIAWLVLLFGSQWQWLLFIALSVTLAFQFRMVLPYTKIWKKEVQSAKNKPESAAHQLKIMNLLQFSNIQKGHLHIPFIIIILDATDY